LQAQTNDVWKKLDFLLGEIRNGSGIERIQDLYELELDAAAPLR